MKRNITVWIKVKPDCELSELQKLFTEGFPIWGEVDSRKLELEEAEGQLTTFTLQQYPGWSYHPLDLDSMGATQLKGLLKAHARMSSHPEVARELVLMASGEFYVRSDLIQNQEHAQFTGPTLTSYDHDQN